MPHDRKDDGTAPLSPSATPDITHDKKVSDADSEWDEISESSWESFPASDPPSWVGQGSSASHRKRNN